MKTIDREETATATREKFTGKAVLSQVVIASLAVSPDGETIVYGRRTVEDGKYARRLWRTTFEGTAPEQLTSAKANDGRPRFSPDGRKLLFISDRSGKPQVWMLNLAGGEPRQITDLAGGVGAAEWSPDGSRLAVLGGSGEKRFIVGNADDPTARRIRDYTWRFDGAGYRDEFSSVWVTDVDEPSPKRITEPTYDVHGIAWSPDGQQIAFLADRGANAGLEEIDAIWTIGVDGGEPKQMASLKGGILNLAWAPGSEIAYVGSDQDGSPGWANVELHIAGKRVGPDLNVQLSSYGDYQDQETFGPAPVFWQDEDHAVALVSHRGFSHPYRFGKDGTVEALAKPEAVCNLIATGGGKVVVAASTYEPSDVYAVEGGKLRRLTTDGGKWHGPFTREIEHVQIKHREGHDIDTRFVAANGKRTKAPMVVVVHGGPEASFGPTPWFEMNALPDAGIHVVYCNPRGSVSYGEQFSKDLQGRWGDPDGSDLLRVIDWAVEEKKIDRKKVGIMGLSYGGFLTNWMIANHPGVFGAAVSENPVTDLIGEWATSDFGRYIGRRAVEKQNAWENLDEFLARSPFVKMHQNKAPLLLLHAENDMRCPPGQSEIVFHILRTLGREVEMVRYPQETHIMLAIGRPDRRIDRIDRIVGWFTKHLLQAES